MSIAHCPSFILFMLFNVNPGFITHLFLKDVLLLYLVPMFA